MITLRVFGFVTGYQVRFGVMFVKSNANKQLNSLIRVSPGTEKKEYFVLFSDPNRSLQRQQPLDPG